jgi:hypothetical protein
VKTAAEHRSPPSSATVTALFRHRWTTSVQLPVHEAPPHPPLLRTSVAFSSFAPVGLNFSLASPRHRDGAVEPVLRHRLARPISALPRLLHAFATLLRAFCAP